MFNRKRTKSRELRRIVEETRAELIKVNGQCTHYRRQADALRTERDEMMKANGHLKHDLETESRQKEELAALLVDAQKQVEEVKFKWGAENKEQAHTIETQQNELRAMFEKMSAVPVRPACPQDCVKHANPGPGASACRNCTRNPHAVDKYQKEETA